MTVNHLLLLFAVLAILASIWLTSERKTDRQFKEDDRRRQPQSQREEDVEHRPSPDFAAMIDAIHNEALANRNEGKREDRGQKFRDYAGSSLN